MAPLWEKPLTTGREYAAEPLPEAKEIQYSRTCNSSFDSEAQKNE
jgi:hypothetical protein